MSTTVKKKGLGIRYQGSGKTPSVTRARDTSPAGAGKERKRKGRGKGSTGNNAGGFVPTKGGDGGAPVKVRRGPNWSANARVVLTGASIACKADRAAFELLLVETTDRCDRAHNEKKLIVPGVNPQLEDSWVLCGLGEIDLPAAKPVSRPRRYHPSQVVGRPGKQVGVDSMFDALAVAAQRLQDAGIEMGMHTTRVGECSRMEQALRHRYEGEDWHTIRDQLEQKTTQQAITREDIDG